MKKIIGILIFITLPFGFTAKGQGNYGKSVLVGMDGLTAVFNDTNRPTLKRWLPFQTLINPIGFSNICDSATGNPILFFSKNALYDTLGNIIDNGDSLVSPYIGWVSNFENIMQNTIMLPLGNKRFMLAVANITDSNINNCFLDTLCLPIRANCDDWRYNIIDMKLNNGMGKVVTKNKSLLYKTPLKMGHQTACKHANGKDWWLLKPAIDPIPKMYRFLITADSIYGPYTQLWEDEIDFLWNNNGQMQFSPDGSKYASVLWFDNRVITGDFDRCTGLLSNRKVYTIPMDTLKCNVMQLDTAYEGVAFSPNNRYIYVARNCNIMQLDTYESDSNMAWYLVKKYGDSIVPGTNVYYLSPYANLHNGIDGRIYVGHWGGTWGLGMSVIDHPNEKGVLCGWCNQCLDAPIADSFTLTNVSNMPNYNLGPTSNPNCWPSSSSEINDVNSMLEVYPNPTSSVFYIKNRKGKKKELYNIVGELLYSTTKEEIEVSNYAKGIYFIKCEGQTKKVLVE